MVEPKPTLVISLFAGGAEISDMNTILRPKSFTPLPTAIDRNICDRPPCSPPAHLSQAVR
jgi:hypothetical protein